MVSLRTLAGALLLAAPLATLQAQAATPQKFAYVDSRKIVNAAPGTSGAQGVLQREVTAMEAEVKKMSDALDAMTTAFTKEQAALTPEKRDARIKTITERQAEAQGRYEALRQQAQEREGEVMQPILDQIKLAIEDVRVEMGYTMIFDVAQTGAIVAADKNLDLSERVIAKLRTMPIPVVAARATDAGAKGGAKVPPAGGPVSGPAGVGRPGATVPPGTKRPDSTAKSDSAKKADSTAKKVPPL